MENEEGYNSGREIYFKVKLEGGRILGPLNLRRIAKLIDSKQIVGNEIVREYPNGEWKQIAIRN